MFLEGGNYKSYWGVDCATSPFYRSKIGSRFLKLCHFFGFKMNLWLEEDVTLRLPTQYKDTYHYLFDESPEWIIEDVISSVHYYLKSDAKLEFRCRMAGFIWVRWQENDWNSSRVFPYRDGTLYVSKESYLRDSKIDKLLF